VQNIDSKPKAFWQYIDSRSQLKICPSISEILSPSGSTVCSDSEKASLFNDYFSSIFTTEDTVLLLFQQFVPVILSFQLIVLSIDITPDIVFDKIMNLQSGEFAGPDSWPIQLIKSGELISIPLLIIFNKSFVDGVLPQDWKSAHV